MEPNKNNLEQFSAEFERFIEIYLKKELGLRRLHINIFNTLVTLIIGSLGLISALAWDTFLKEMFNHIFGESTLRTEFIYAITITIVTVVVTVILGKIFKNTKEK